MGEDVAGIEPKNVVVVASGDPGRSTTGGRAGPRSPFPHHKLLYFILSVLFLCEATTSFVLYLYVSRVEDACLESCERAARETPVEDSELVGAMSRGVDLPFPFSAPVKVGGMADLGGVGGERRRRRRRSLRHENNVHYKWDASVDFLNPEQRRVLEEKERSNPREDAASNPLIWMTSYSRIPLVAIQGFCSASREYCPDGPPGPQGHAGLPGIEGEKGERGDRGFPGEPGLRGPPGIPGDPGPRGPKGEAGWPGSPGLDGRDGVPGEPGLDGIPGRNGMDGSAGTNGIPGINGMPGRSGTNGTDGRPGSTGPIGPPGSMGPRGLPGPRGRSGRPGTNGTPGIPGINAWNVTNSATKKLLIPPSISNLKDSDETVVSFSKKPIVVNEGELLRMRCAASGVPTPDVEWRKQDGSVIPMGQWKTISISGHTMNLTRIHRTHMGIYQCIANNGVPPQANLTFNVHVHFPPLIRIHNQMVGAVEGSHAVLECEVEAFPETVKYWERADGRIIDSGDKFRMKNEEYELYKAKMYLNITRVSPADFGRYHCISKNELGVTTGKFTLFRIDPNLATPPPLHTSMTGGGQGVVVYGERPPEQVTLEDLCPPPAPCPNCSAPKEPKCREGSISLFDLLGRLEIRPFGNETFPGLPNRSMDCVLYAVGKPVYLRYTDALYGGWMRDPVPRTEADAEKFWVTKEGDNHRLYEYANKTMFRKDIPSKNYTLERGFKGNSHVVYNGSFYYNQLNHSKVIRFDLTTESYVGVEALEAPHSGGGANYLYTTDYNYLDFSTDENGLWVIYGLPPPLNNTIVMKLDAVTLKREYIWNISIDHHKVGEMFVVCGVLYAVDNVTETNTKIRLALDLYKNKLLDVNLAFTNPFRKTTMIGYNSRNRELYTWDKGNQLTYPVRYNAIDYNVTKEEKGEPEANAQVQTGYDVFS